ncbi:cytochrome P450 [Artomyces pyxidatus]|uniref:Cytochrome P450 n=1 Tax=Artomyces pyxidatus TaxID=48021 RepID=A0ACB8SIR4_9AGAM|nr:cytochrome P450 [Artomyces pyxidatus]
MASSWTTVSGNLNATPVLLVVGLLTFCIVRYLRSPWRKLPPGPRGLPFLGNIRELSDSRWLTSSAPKETYGEIMYLSVIGQPIMVLNSQRVAADLLDRRARIYSSRPRLILASEIYTGGVDIALAYHNDIWRRMRRAVHEGLSASAVKRYNPIQAKEAAILALDLLANGSEWNTSLRRHSASLIMSTVYDTPTITPGDPVGYEPVKKINDHGVRMQRILMPGSSWVEIFPWMKKIPSRFAKWKRLGEYWFARDTELFQGLLGKVKNDISHGIENETLGATLLKQQDRSELSDLEIAWLGGTMFVAGADTTSISLGWWLFAMLLNPDAQKRAQAELDAVVGRDRVPTFSDLPRLPYIRAMVKETLRWRPALPFALPHSTTEDDWYEGMFIPKGTVCIPNIKPCNLDPAIYGDDAALFVPERHLDAEGALKPGHADTKEEGHVAYGFGRRICVGRHMANDTMAIAMATALWAAEFHRAKDEHGVDLPLDPDDYVDNHAIQRPVPFKCNTVLRFPEALDLLAEERDRQG